MQLSDYLGGPISQLLSAQPFNQWPVERSTEEDLPERVIDYVFEGNGLEVRCNGYERIEAVFLYSDEYGGFDDSLFEIPFSATRASVLGLLGRPRESGAPLDDSVLGRYGAWDRFARRPGVDLHVQYRVNADTVDRFTLVRVDLLS